MSFLAKPTFACFQNNKYQGNLGGSWLVLRFSFFNLVMEAILLWRQFSKQHHLKEREEAVDNGLHWYSICKYRPTTSLNSHFCDPAKPSPVCPSVRLLHHLCIATTVLCLWLYVHSDFVTTIPPVLVWSTILSLHYACGDVTLFWL